MRINKRVILEIIFTICIAASLFSQSPSAKPFKTLNVADGLPQSFISGIVQDSTGFIWIGTRDGLARYDGRKFKLFRHLAGDTTTLANSVISSLYLDKYKRLWIRFETGDMDVMYTGTETLFHFTKDPVFRATFFSLRGRGYIAEDAKKNIWLVSNDGGLFYCDLEKKKMDFYSDTSLGLQGNKILSITSFGNEVLLVTDTALLTINKNNRLSPVARFDFQKINEYNSWIQSGKQYIMTRQTGEIIVKDDDKLLISDPVKKLSYTLTLPGKPIDNKFWMKQDNRNNIFFNYNNNVYVLSTSNKLKFFAHTNESEILKAVSILYDNSGVVWIGSNGDGIRLFDLRITHLSGLPYQKNFHEDVLQNILHVPAAEIKNTFLYNMYPYSLQWAAAGKGRIWLSKSGASRSEKTELCYYENGHVISPPWHYTDTLSAAKLCVNSMALSKSGKLWGIDFKLRPIYFDTATYAVTMYPYPSIAAPLPEFNPTYAVNSLLIDGEDTFWISTTFNGLYCYNKRTGKIINYTYSEVVGALPTNLLMSMINDPVDNNILWIGSLGV